MVPLTHSVDCNVAPTCLLTVRVRRSLNVFAKLLVVSGISVEGPSQ